MAVDVKPQTLERLISDAWRSYDVADAQGDEKAMFRWMRQIASLMKQQRAEQTAKGR